MGLKLNDVALSYGSSPFIDHLSFTVGNGQIVSLVGPSGCGKTTTLRLLAGLESPERGSISLNGRTVFDRETNVPPEQRRVGLLFQDYALFPHLSVRQNIGFGLNKHPDRDAIVDEMVEMVGMTAFTEAMPHTLSGGQQQRVALARALATKPDVLLLDEPFSGLDTALKAKLRASTYEILKKNNITTVMVTHDPEEALYMGDLIVLMREGKIVQKGTPIELYSQPNSEFCAAFFGDVCYFNGLVQGGRIETPIGNFDAEGRPSGETVRLLIRPEHLRITPVSLDVISSEATQSAREAATGHPQLSSLFQLTDVHFLGEKKLLTLMPMDDPLNVEPLVIRAQFNHAVPLGMSLRLQAERSDILYMKSVGTLPVRAHFCALSDDALSVDSL